MTETGRALLNAVIAAPDDDTPRLVYADYLEENGHDARAKYIRLAIELAGEPEKAHFAQEFRQTFRQLKNHREDFTEPELRRRLRIPDDATCRWWSDLHMLCEAREWRWYGPNPKWKELSCQCEQMLETHRHEWEVGFRGMEPKWDRGFISEIQVGISEAPYRASESCLEQPIQKIFVNGITISEEFRHEIDDQWNRPWNRPFYLDRNLRPVNSIRFSLPWNLVVNFGVNFFYSIPCRGNIEIELDNSSARMRFHYQCSRQTFSDGLAVALAKWGREKALNSLRQE